MERTTHSAFATATLDYRSHRSVLAGKALTLLWGLLPVLAFLLHSAAQAQISIPYTASGTFTPPTGVTQVTVECWGAGGHGSTRSNNGAGGGGGGGAYVRSTVNVIAGNPYTVTVGAGSTSSSPGGDSWFGSASTVMAKGGGSVGNNITTGANGGSAASSIGTVKFSGGNGATTFSANAGGGGSSAGTAANGNNGSVSAGATAPSGGGDGGDGATSNNTDGSNGSVPGGGGGGAKKSSGGTTRNGGDGADGMVRISYSYTLGTCMSAVSGNAITDNGCGTSPLVVVIPVSGLPTSLGTSAGNAQLTNISFIISHTYNADLDITLTSPSGTTRNMVLDRFGNGNNLGNPASCPGSAFVLQDGGTALSSGNASNVVGTYAPEQSLAGFTGNPNGNWTLTICDDAAVDVGNLRYFNMDFCTVPSTANAGTNQTICATGSATLAANNPAFGTGAWSVVSGPSTSTAQFSSTSANNATFTPAGGAGTYVLRWTVSSGSCSSSTSNVTITVNAAPTTANAGPNQTICTSVGTVTMAGNTPSVGSGTWSQVSGPVSASIVAPSSPTTLVNGLTTAGSYVFRWSIANGVCPASTSTMTVTSNGVPTTANAGPPQSVCANPGSATMAANTPSIGAGNWTQVSGPVTATIVTPGSPSTAINGMTTAGAYIFRWTISNSPCISSQSNVTITVVPPPTAANAGPDQTVCVSPGTTVMAANTPLVGSGSWSQVSGPVAVSFADASDPASGVSGLSTQGAYVFRWSIITAGCASNDDDVTVSVSASPTSALAGPDQEVCSTLGSATMAANAPSVGTGAWSQIAGPVTATIANTASPNTGITGMTTPGTYTFRWTISNSPCAASTDDVDVVSGGCTYYSRASGNITDPIWSTTPTGTPGYASFIAAVSMVVQSGHTISNTTITTLDDLTVEAGGQLNLMSSTSLQVNGTSVLINGTLNAQDNSELELAGASATALTLASTTSFFDLTVNTPAGTTVSGTAHIRGTLLLQDGAFNCTANPVVLRSTSTYTGRLGPVAATASYTGNMRIERYVPAGATNWRLIGSPINGRKVNHLQDDFFTAGYPGSQYPNFFDPPGSGIFWPSVRWYDETNTGSNVNDGLVGVSSNNQAMTPGQGFAAWCGTNLTTTNAFVIDLENNTPVIASTPINLPVTYTNTGNPTVDGWNLVANPLPSPIAFDQIARGADVDDYVTFFDPSTGNMATWDISLNAGTNGGTNTIQSMQGFYLKASGPAVTTTVDESDKVAGNSGGFFGGTEEAPAMVSLHISSAINSFSDETLLLFSQGTPAVDGDDVPKMMFAHPQAPQVATQGNTGVPLAINAYGPYSADVSIPVLVQAGVAGSYTISVTGVESAGLSCLKLEDLVTSTIIPLNEGSTYTFDLATGNGMSTPRFLLHATAPLDVLAQAPACFGGANGEAQVDLGIETADVTWMNDMGQTLQQQIGATGLAIVDGLGQGDFQVQVSGYKGCASLSTTFHVEQPEALSAGASVMDASCPGIADGGINLTIDGGVAPYLVAWSNGSTDLDLVAGPGTYSGIITDANGCTFTVGSFGIDAGEAPVAGVEVVSSTVLIGEEVQFTSTSVDATTYAWDFGDGTTSEEADPLHTYDVPGMYVVTLTVSNGTCSSTATVEMTVEVNTSVAEAAQGSIAAWLNGDNLVVEHGFADQYPLVLEVMNEAGQLFQQYRVAGPAGRLTIPATELSSGIWYLRVSNNEVRRTIPVVVVR